MFRSSTLLLKTAFTSLRLYPTPGLLTTSPINTSPLLPTLTLRLESLVITPIAGGSVAQQRFGVGVTHGLAANDCVVSGQIMAVLLLRLSQGTRCMGCARGGTACAHGPWSCWLLRGGAEVCAAWSRGGCWGALVRLLVLKCLVIEKACCTRYAR